MGFKDSLLGNRTRALSLIFALGCFATLPVPHPQLPNLYNALLIFLWLLLGGWSWSLWFRPELSGILWSASFLVATLGFLKFKLFLQAPLLLLWSLWLQLRQTRIAKNSKPKLMFALCLLGFGGRVLAADQMTEEEIKKMEQSAGTATNAPTDKSKASPTPADTKTPVKKKKPEDESSADGTDEQSTPKMSVEDLAVKAKSKPEVTPENAEKSAEKVTSKNQDNSSGEKTKISNQQLPKEKISDQIKTKAKDITKDAGGTENVNHKESESAPSVPASKDEASVSTSKVNEPAKQIEPPSADTPKKTAPSQKTAPNTKAKTTAKSKSKSGASQEYDKEKYEAMSAEEVSTLPKSEKDLIIKNLPKPNDPLYKAGAKQTKDVVVTELPKYLTGYQLNDFSSCSVYDRVPWKFAPDRRKKRLLMKDKFRHQSETVFRTWELYQVMDGEGFVTYIFRTALSSGRYEIIAVKDTIYNRFIEGPRGRKQIEVQDLKTLVNRAVLSFYSEDGGSVSLMPSSIGRSALVIQQGKADGRMLPPIYIRGNTCDRPEDEENSDSTAKTMVAPTPARK